jgi:glycosyltransferase involved in cell wall biosynthesis
MNDETTVLHVITHSEWGGAQRVVALLAKRLPGQTTVACGPGGRLVQELLMSDVNVETQPHLRSPPDPVSDFRALVDLRRLFGRVEPDIVHLHSTKAGILGRIAAMRLDCPTVFTVHGWGFYNTGYPRLATGLRYLERLLAARTTEIVCVSRADYERGVKHGILDGRGTVIQNGIEQLPHGGDVDLRAELDLDSNATVVGSVGRLVEQKNPIEAIEALCELRSRGVEAELVLVGSGPLLSDCRRYVNERELDSVHLLGFREDAYDLLADFDVFLMPSKFEGLPLSAIEACQLGVPVVAYDVGGISEVVVDGECGYVVPAGDRGALVDALERLATDQALRIKYSRMAIERAHERFSADRMIADYETVYNRLLEGV